MDNNNEQEGGFDVINAINDDDDDDDTLLEVIYRGDQLFNIPNVPYRLIIHASVTEVDEQICWGCRMLREIVFHNNVTRIGRRAFGGCRNLERIELPAGLLRLEYDAFWGCTSLRGEIVIPATVQFIEDEVFGGCESLQTVVFTPRTTSIELGNYIFSGCSDLRFVTLPQNLHSIPAYFFCDCTSLTHLQLPASIEEIGEEALSGSRIQATKILEEDEFIPGTIMLPPKLHSISERCFMNCQAFTNIRIPPSVERFGMQSFKGSAIQSIVMSNNVHTRIDQAAFEDCAFLERVTIHSTNLTMGNNIFVNCPLLSVIMIAPWMWPKLFVSMNEHPDFILKFFRHYHTEIFDFETSGVRLIRRLRRRLRR